MLTHRGFRHPFGGVLAPADRLVPIQVTPNYVGLSSIINVQDGRSGSSEAVVSFECRPRLSVPSGGISKASRVLELS